MNQDDDGFVARLGIHGGFVMYCLAVYRDPLALQALFQLLIFHIKQLVQDDG